MSFGSEALDCFEKDLGIDPEELSSEDMETVREEWEDFVQDSFEPDEPERLPGYDLDLDGTTYRIRVGDTTGCPKAKPPLTMIMSRR